ncbi:PC-esterase domain-containing protein 1A isoform X2 [Brachyhypopomus gauderio]|uniref:PC-esterase domain-containing protein 1A isoform X2 n=1 Tax=Brachyhypopomus gauderio TaxID=698409 RepID=UPI0040419E2B
MRNITHHQASQLLHNKFVVVIGDSIQRSVYKDLVLILQKDSYLILPQLRSKGELCFEQDCLVEGGQLGHMTNGTEYREVRQYRTDHHLVRFYFITRVFSLYMESILADFRQDLKPDVVIVNSCVWDVSRYNRDWITDYKENLNKFFWQMKAILPEESLLVWNMTMPLGNKIVGGFLVPEIMDIGPMLRYDVIEANFYGARLADAYGLDVLDLHYMFRFSLHHRMKDGIHWNGVAHRQITCLLLAHVAQAWGVQLPEPTAMGPCEGLQQQISKHNMHQLDNGDQSMQFPNGTHIPYGHEDRTDSGHYRGLYENARAGNHHITPNDSIYTDPTWQQRQHFNGFNTLPHFNTGYWSCDVERNGGERYNGLPPPNGRPVYAAPSWPANNLVMKQRHRTHQYNPYIRKKPNRRNRY